MTRIALALLTLCSTPALAQPDDARGLAQELRKDWDLLGLEVDATSSHTLVFAGPRYQALTASGLYLDVAAGAGVSVRESGAPVFGQGHAMAGYSLVRGLKNRDTLFNLYQTNSSDASGTETTYHYLETEVIAQRNLVVLGGVRSILGRGPDLSDGSVAPAYASLVGGVALLTTWRQVQEHGGERRMLRGVEGFELLGLYAPQDSASENFSNFRHIGAELRIHKTAELGRWATPFHLGLGIEPGLGPMLRLGMLFPVASPLAGPAQAKVGEVR